MRSIARMALGVLAGVPGLACVEDEPTEDLVTARDQLEVAHRFDVTVDGSSSVVLATSLTLGGETTSQWLALPVAGGELIAEAPDDQLVVQAATVELVDLPLAREGVRVPVMLRELRFVLAAPLRCAADWSADGETAGCGEPARLRVELSIEIDGVTIALPPISLGPITLRAHLEHVGPELRLDLAGQVGGVDWSWADLQATGTLAFDVRGAALADTWRRDTP